MSYSENDLLALRMKKQAYLEGLLTELLRAKSVSRAIHLQLTILGMFSALLRKVERLERLER